MLALGDRSQPRWPLVAAALVVVLLCTAHPALASQARYTLTITEASTVEETRSHAWCTEDGCSFGGDESHDSSSVVARSVRPFLIRRTAYGRVHFAFTAQVAGTSSGTGAGSSWSRSTSRRTGVHACSHNSSGTSRGRVSGTVSMQGLVPARVKLDLRQQITGTTKTTGGCDGAVRTDTKSGTSTGNLSRWLRTFDLRRAFGHAFTLTDQDTHREGAHVYRYRWTLHFVPVDQPEPERRRWQVDVTGADRWAWGMYPTLGAGIWVTWLHRTILEVKDGKLVSATGKVHVLDVSRFSDVEGALTVTHETKTPPEYRVPKRQKSGDRVVLGLLKLDRSEYRADFSVQAGPKLLQTLREMDLPQPDERYQAMVARGAVRNRVHPLVPMDPRVVVLLRDGWRDERETDAFAQQLPCAKFKGTEPECFLRRGGETITVTRLR